MNKITSNQNPKIKEIVKLRKAKQRKKTDLFIIEGVQELGMAIKSGIQISSLFYCADYLKDKSFLSQLHCDIYELDKNTFNKISLRENPDGVLAFSKPKNMFLGDIKLSKNPFLLILESIEKPGNLGAIFRTADACGVDYIVICEPKTDIYNPNVIRSSLGTLFTNKIVICKNSEIFSWLKKNNIKSFAATPNADMLYTEANFNGAIAITIGTEHEGLSTEWLKSADYKIKIPMKGKIDSLNASVSAAIILFEASRQREK